MNERVPTMVSRQEGFHKLVLQCQITPAGCWQWTGPTNGHGYGLTSIGSRRVYTHRLAYEVFGGHLSGQLHVDHLCKNTLCFNPEHLEQVTAQENWRRGDGRSARNARKTHCDYGHGFRPENTYVTKDGRQCRECNRRRARGRSHAGKRFNRSSKFRGVTFDRASLRWRAAFRIDSQRIEVIGLYSTELDAARAHDAVVIARGSGARLCLPAEADQ